ncbi:MAG: DUF1552 domain-containing protein [Myxococcales bacterium]|nr:DUF1552 domain-containing protein [Myxococcales bacterium]
MTGRVRGVGPARRLAAAVAPSRRGFLRGVLQGSAVFVGLPLFGRAFNGNGTALACGGVIPKRFGIFFWGNGNRPERWIPATDGDSWELSEALLPLVNVKAKLSVVTGLSVKVPNLLPHTSGAAGLLSGMTPLSDDGVESFAGPTIDQIIAGEVGGDTPYASLQTAASDCSGESWNGVNSRNPPETDPYALYERLFGPTFRLPGEEGLVDPTLGLRRSVLDSVIGDITTLQGRLGAADKARLDQHLTGVRELEERLARLEEDPPSLESCGRPAFEPEASYPDIEGRPQLSARSRIVSDMLAMALACDQTRVFGHYVTDPVANPLFPGATAGHHNLTHDEGGDQPEVHAITVQIVAELAYLLERLDEVPEAGGTLLDNCCVLACSEVGLGQTHSIDDVPIVVAGGLCGTLRTGIHHRSYTGDNSAMLMLSILRGMDILAPSFGADDAYTEDGLSEIEV